MGDCLNAVASQIVMGRLTGLDALRGIAALLVVLYHAEQISAQQQRWFAASYLAVDFFFMLSGYVLARAFERRLAEGGLTAAQFMKLRIKRLWPVLAVGAVLGLVALIPFFGAFWGLILYLMALAMIPQMWLSAQPIYPSNPPSWSIGFELLANAIHGLALAKMTNVGLAMISASCLAVLLAFSSDMDVGVVSSEFLLGIARVGISYPIGILVWRLHGDRPMVPSTYAIIGLPLLIFVGPMAGPWFDFAFVLLACPALIIAGLGDNRFGATLGATSYPLYAVHYPIEVMIINNGGPVWLAILSALGGATLVAWYLEPRSHHAIKTDNRPINEAV